MKNSKIVIIMSLAFIFSFLMLINNSGSALSIDQTAATNIHVAPTGSDNGSCGAIAAPCKTIQQAVNLSKNGDTILVATGTYTGSNVCAPSIETAVVCIWNKHLIIRGGYAINNWSVANPSQNVTTIDGQNSRRGIYFWGTNASTASLFLEGFTIQNGRQQGISSSDDNKSFAFGGGMLVDLVPVTIKYTIFQNNKAIGADNNSAHGGAAGGGGLAIRAVDNAVLEHITFIGNEARGGVGPERGGFAIGGGLFTYQSVLSGDYLTFQSNKSLAGSSNGSGLSDGERADAQGAGAAFQIGSSVNVQHLDAFDNQAIGGNAPNGDAGGAFGGGVFAEAASLTLTDSFFFGNLAQGGNGRNSGQDASLGIGGALSTSTAEVIIDRVTVVNNIARGGNGAVNSGSGGGGGVYFTGQATIQLSNMIIADNLAEMGSTGSLPGGGGGGLFAYAADLSMTQMTFARNKLGGSPMQGAGIVLVAGSNATISHSIVADHTEYATAFAIHAQPSNTATLDNNLFFGNNSNTGGGGAFPGSGSSFSGNPGFVSPGAPNYDYHLTSSSAAINKAATSNMHLDIDNQHRSEISLPDVGADEFVPFTSFQSVSGDTSVSLNWQVDGALLPGLAWYEVVVTPSTGAVAPTQGTSFSVGLNTNITLTHLTNYKSYTIVVEARNQAGDLLAKSSSVTVMPTDIFVYLPIVIK
jgi:hypothetical protein